MKKFLEITRNLIFNIIATFVVIFLVKAIPVHLTPIEQHLGYYSFETTRSQISSSEGVWFLSDTVVRQK